MTSSAFFDDEPADGAYPCTDLLNVLYTAEQAIRGLNLNDDLSDLTRELYRDVFGLVQDLRLSVFLRKEIGKPLGPEGVKCLPDRERTGGFWLKSTEERIAQVSGS